MFGVYEAYSCDNIPELKQRAHFTTELLAKEWAELKAKKEHTNVSFVVINLTDGIVVTQIVGWRKRKEYGESKHEPSTILEGKVDIQI